MTSDGATGRGRDRAAGSVRRSIARPKAGAGSLSYAGVAVAGDAFDYRIIDNVISPQLGKGSSYRSLDKLLPAPNRNYSAFARWSQLALLKSSRELRELRALARTALDPRLQAFVEFD